MSKEVNNAGCKSCRYYLHTNGDCLQENTKGQYMRKGLIGECVLFKPIQKQPSDNQTEWIEIPKFLRRGDD